MSWLTDGAVRLALRACRDLVPTKIFWYSFLLEAQSTPGLKGLGKLTQNKFNGLIGNRSRDLRTFSKVLHLCSN
jgi:hypothetical protein